MRFFPCGRTLLLFVCFAGAGVPAEAQETAVYRQRAIELIDLWREAARAGDIADSVLRNRTGFDTLQLGSLLIFAQRSQRVDAFRAARQVWTNNIVPTLQSDTNLLGDVAFFLTTRVYRTGTPVHPDREVRTARVNSYVGDTFERTLRSQIERWLNRNTDSTYGRWLGRGPLSVAQPDWAEAYTDLITSPSHHSRDCLAGEVVGCRVALGLIQPDDPLSEWYTPDDMREIVASMEKIRSVDPEAAVVCIDRRWDDVCRTYLERAYNDRVTPPLARETRFTLHKLAWDYGGDGAIGRMLRATASVPGGVDPETALSHIAQIPPDSLIAMWRERVLAAEPNATTMNLATILTSSGWTIILFGLALRSTRWR